jgi:hypothetical protein
MVHPHQRSRFFALCIVQRHRVDPMRGIRAAGVVFGEHGSQCLVYRNQTFVNPARLVGKGRAVLAMKSSHFVLM